MADSTDSGYAAAGLTVGDTYTLVVSVWREPGSPVIAAAVNGGPAGTPIVATGSWEESRVEFVATSTSHRVGIRRLDTEQGRIYLGGAAVVTGHYEGGFFTGVSPLHNYIYSDGLASPSREVSGVSSASTLTTERAIPGAVGAGMLAFDARSELGAVLVVKLLSADDLSTLATDTVVAPSTWTRFVLPVPTSRNVLLQVDATGSYDIREPILEKGTLERPFFDPTASVDGYTVGWLERPHRSPSRLRWIGEARTEREDSSWRPFLSVDGGELPGVTVTTSQFEPVDLEECLAEYERHFHDVSAIEGPTTISEVPLKHGAAREVEFLLNAGSPFPYAPLRPVLNKTASQIPAQPFADPVEVVTPVDVLVDPDCAPLLTPPRPPAIPDLCVDTSLGDWQRRWVTIPADQVASWATTVPTVTLTSRDEAIRQLRVRVHPNPFDYEPDVVDPTSYCSEFIVSYMPPNTVLTLDGRDSKASAQVAGGNPVPANHLLYGTGGVPMTWPELSCGISYVLTIDAPPQLDPNNLSVDVALSRRG